MKNTLDEALSTLPVRVRKAFYTAQVWVSLVSSAGLAGLAVWTAASGEPAPLWVPITLAVFAAFGIVPGRTATNNISE